MTKASLLLLFTCLFLGNSYAQIRQTTVIKPTNKSPTYNIKQRNLEAEQQAFANRSNKDEAWFYENANYGGRKFVLERGSYSLKELGIDLNDFLSSALIPLNLIVVAYTDDNFSGDWYILKPDNAGNLNFENTAVVKAKVGGRLMSGKVNINDVISSIVVYNPDQDYVLVSEFHTPNNKDTYNDLGNHNVAKFFKTYPAPYINGTDGHNMNELGPLNDNINIFDLSNSKLTVQIYQDANFQGYQCTLKKEVRNYGDILGARDVQFLMKISLTDCGTIGSVIGRDRAWENRVSSFKVNIAPGRITEIIK